MHILNRSISSSDIYIVGKQSVISCLEGSSKVEKGFYALTMKDSIYKLGTLFCEKNSYLEVIERDKRGTIVRVQHFNTIVGL